ncbi:tRNA (adenine(58)-N(1))-methyltransferase non-catalytic subunit trm6 [Lachnellula arida]|uniref:tRNA (adenine(58)-N(1))-methyltransferase non-catalytic subunit TRM6 n=1 Tax=Lachnellula arida TaxID=1316785 RepID=A0A8T9B4X3_9HELO|nr:tRNA (adenine(58)-N(1))-methyltransferase non-catalytic subunit trm6 [Lachnellula arida]
MHSLVTPNAWVVLRLPSDSLKVLQIVPNTIVSLGKYGTFSSNLIIERPYNLTYELLDRQPGQKDSDLRIVPASEIHADTIAEEDAASNPKDAEDKVVIGGDGVEFELLGENGEVIIRSNRETIDDSARQTLTMEEIEVLKREGTGAGKDLIAKLMLSHTGIDQKTTFSLAKYKLLKTKKYLKRFTVLPLDVPLLTHWMMTEKDANKILEMRNEMVSLIGSWSNVHFSESLPDTEGGRWLVVDETGGLLVAAMAERMGILHPPSDFNWEGKPEGNPREEAPPATSNTITLVHNNAQPNLSLLKYFLYDPTTTSPPCPTHPLNNHLHALSWLQLLKPSEDTTYSSQIETLSPDELSQMKSAKRGTYYRKLRRWTKTTHIVNSTLNGGFDGLAIASSMDPSSILRHTLPLLRGGASISIYSPTIEPLVTLADLYSTSRRTAFIQAPPASFSELDDEDRGIEWQGDEDFPLNPTLVLNASVQSARVREWQVLPGRTHPMMTGKGGAEGYLFTGVRVLPAKGKVEARGKFGRKKRGDEKAGAVVKEDMVDEEGVTTIDTEMEDTKEAKSEDLEMAGL